MKKYLLYITFLFCSLLIKVNVIAQDKSSYPVIDGTFIQDNLVANWNDARWQKELNALKEVGMHYIIFAPTLHTNKEGVSESMYPSTLHDVRQKYKADLVDNCLRNAAKAGFKVFLGLNFNEEWWTGQFRYEWLKHQMETGNKVADELVKKYKNKYGEVMYGWYWVWEVDNIHCKTTFLQDELADILNVNLDHLHAITPSMPFMLCPFMNYRLGTAGQNRDMWERVFAGTHFNKGDIFAPQDCIGAGGLKLDTLSVWFREMKKAADTKPGLLFWSDAETFDQRFWTIAPLNRLVKQLEIEKPYVSNIISFAYSHYYSPYKVNKKYHEAYSEYVRTGVLPVSSLKGSVSGLKLHLSPEHKPVLTWKAPKDSGEVAGYYIFRNEELMTNIQPENKGINTSQNTFADNSSLKNGKYKYAVCAYSFTGVATLKRMLILKLNNK
ncbi:MAG TPA: DUF4434 domain-containing protein [Mucilaginibacter sp.]|jgi:hypothetical protein